MVNAGKPGRTGDRRAATDGDDRGSATRRSLLTSLLALLFAGTAGSRYLVGFTRADAAVTDLTVSGDSVTTDSGQISSLTASVSGHVSYDGLDTAAATVETALYAAPSGGAITASGNRIDVTTADVATTDGLGTNAGHLDFSFTGTDVLAAADLSKSDFAATGDGSIKDTDVDFRLALSVTDSGGTELVSSAAVATATISVTNQSRQGGANGNGNANVSGTNQSP